MTVIGKRRGVSLVYGIKVQGIPAWMLWRSVFLYKMPVLGKRLRVVIDWTEDLLFDRDIARLTFMRKQKEDKTGTWTRLTISGESRVPHIRRPKLYHLKATMLDPDCIPPKGAHSDPP